MIGTKCLPYLAALGLVLGGPAQATLPPLSPPQYGAYGPLILCEGDLSIAVEPNEAAHVVGSIFRIINDDYVVAATPALLPISSLASPGGTSKTDIIGLGNLTLAFRYRGELPQSGAGDAIFAREGFRDGDVRYAIATQYASMSSDSLQSMLIIASPSFDGSEADKAILSRFRVDAANPPACIRPAGFAAGKPDRGAAAFVESFDDPFYPGLYPAAPTGGPGYHCLNGIGFALYAGERLRRPWQSLQVGQSHLMRGNVVVTLSGPVEPMRPTDPGDAREHPAGQLHGSGVTFYPSRGVGPPYAPPGVREDGSWLIELGKDKNSRLEIRFPAGDKALAGFALIERLEFVAPGDPRCGTAPR